MGDLIYKKKPAAKEPMEIQADLIATALIKELRVQAPGIGWAMSPGLFLGFLAMGFLVSICAGIGWFVLLVII